MDKTDSGKSIKGGGGEKPKAITAAVLGMPTSHGMKLSLNMASHDKKELLCKLEEWRKARREKLVNSILAKQKQAEKLKGFPVLPQKSRPSVMGTVPVDTNGKKAEEKETVFERLYKNSKKKQETEVKVPQFTSQNVKNKTPIVSVVKNKSNVDGKSIKDSRKSSARSSVPSAFEITESVPQNQEDEVSKTETLEQEKESFVEKEKSEVSQENAVQDLNETFQISPPSLIHDSEEKEETVKSDIVNDGLLQTELPSSVERTGTAGDCIEIKKCSETETGRVLEKYSEPEVKNNNEDVDAKFIKRKSPENEKPTLRKSKSNADVFTGAIPSKVPVKVSVKPEKTLRRSISMLYRNKCKPDPAIHRTFSEKNLRELKLEEKKTPFKSTKIPSSAVENEKDARFKTPVKCVTFATPKNTKLLTSTNLRNKLEDWLKSNGHPLEGYRHLRCFGIAHQEKPAPKPLATVADTRGLETPPQNTPCGDDSDKENETPPTAIQQVDVTDVGNWLKELYRLIVELKYPVERCEEWLGAIRRKCATCSQMPVYWECMAALDESRGDMQSAMEHYEKAIIKGKNVDCVGNSLAVLFDKMVIDQKKPSKCKLEKGLDPKNIFKSTIIKFALQQKPLKESDSKTRRTSFVATPVRRSSRIQTPYKPHVVSSLQRLTPDIKNNLTFKTNESLLQEE